ncbi:LOW QUALITY PROTEIN: protein phosphatase 1 regulatory subunit 14A [Chlamydotis macqueenii]
MAANRPGRRGPGGRGGSGGRSPPPPAGLQRRAGRVTVRYNRRELRRRLEKTERWVDGRLEELYRGREGEMPDEVNIDDLLELETDEERAQKLQAILTPCTADIEDFIRELLAQLRAPKQQVLQQPTPEDPHPTPPVTPPHA